MAIPQMLARGAMMGSKLLGGPVGIGMLVGSFVVPAIIDAIRGEGPTPENKAKIKGIIQKLAAQHAAETGMPVSQAEAQITQELGPQLDKAFTEEPGLLSSLAGMGIGLVGGGLAGNAVKKGLRAAGGKVAAGVNSATAKAAVAAGPEAAAVPIATAPAKGSEPMQRTIFGTAEPLRSMAPAAEPEQALIDEVMARRSPGQKSINFNKPNVNPPRKPRPIAQAAEEVAEGPAHNPIEEAAEMRVDPRDLVNPEQALMDEIAQGRVGGVPVADDIATLRASRGVDEDMLKAREAGRKSVRAQLGLPEKTDPMAKLAARWGNV